MTDGIFIVWLVFMKFIAIVGDTDKHSLNLRFLKKSNLRETMDLVIYGKINVNM